MRILIRTSKWAIWSRRLGSFALPLAVLPVLLHRERIIVSDNFHILEIIAMVLAVLAVVLALGAYLRLWFTGDQGWKRATLGLVFGLVCLAPVAYAATLALHYPQATDVSTDFADPPQLVSFVPAHIVGPDEQNKIELAFPNARSRTYPVNATQMFDVVSRLVEARGWEPRARRAPQTGLDDGQINVIAMTLLGWRDEVAIRIAGSAEGARVSMRSVALADIPDLGENGRRIEEFMLALDAQITAMLREAPPVAATDD